MDDHNVVAHIFPAVGTEGYAGAALSIRINENHPGYLPPRRRRPQALDLPYAVTPHGGPPNIFQRGDRELTVDEENHNPLDYEACIKVTFDHIPKTRFGLRTGRSGDAELSLPTLPAVGFYHFALTFDNEYRLVIRDLGSTCGTTVIYGRTQQGRRSNFDWIVGGSDFLEEMSPIIVKVSQQMQFQLLIPRHNVQSKSYRDKVDIFRAGTADADHLLDLGHVGLLSRVKTEVPSGVQTPVSQPVTSITMRRKLGQGSFAVVYRVWNVSTGEQHALKKPFKSSFDAAAWEKEALIMDRVAHKHIVSLLNSCPGPAPWLQLEYVPEGSVEDQLDAGQFFSRFECKQMLAQTSDALAYLHTLEPQIVHRDIKPSNILILYRRPDDIFVKFADFGVSGEGDHLMTFCGTALYLAPEIYEASAIQLEQRERYTALVDIWSLGVVVSQLQCGLPKYKKNQKMGVKWCERVRQRVETTLELGEDDLLSFVLQGMLCLEPNARETAEDCQKEALRLLQSNHREVGGEHCSDILGIEASKIRSDSDESYGDGRRSSSASTIVIAYDTVPQVGVVGESAAALSIERHRNDRITRKIQSLDSVEHRTVKRNKLSMTNKLVAG